MSDKTHYEILGVATDASNDDIRRAFRKIAAESHPDKNPGDPSAEQRFKRANEAHQVLSDPEKRSRYDAELHMRNFGGAPGQWGVDGFAGDFFRHFDDFFGTRAQRKQQRPRQDTRGMHLETKARITLEEAVFGCEHEVTLTRHDTCAGCNGSGAAGEPNITDCSHCNGTGQRVMRTGFVTYTSTCQECSGHGRTLQNPCSACKGSCRTKKEHTLKVTIPAGVDTGDTMRVPGQGDPCITGGQPGDLFVHIVVKPNAHFERVDGRHLVTHAEASYATLVLGGHIDVTLLDGTSHWVNVPPRSRPGSTIVFSGMGCTKYGSSAKGDLRVNMGVKMPDELTQEAEEVLRRFDELI